MEVFKLARIIVFNNDSDRMENYYRNENEAMPYNNGRTLTVGEFRGSSKSPTLWTTKRAMQSFNTTRYLFGGPVPVGFAFKRPWEGGHRFSISALRRYSLRRRASIKFFGKK